MCPPIIIANIFFFHFSKRNFQQGFYSDPKSTKFYLIPKLSEIFYLIPTLPLLCIGTILLNKCITFFYLLSNRARIHGSIPFTCETLALIQRDKHEYLDLCRSQNMPDSTSVFRDNVHHLNMQISEVASMQMHTLQLLS